MTSAAKAMIKILFSIGIFASFVLSCSSDWKSYQGQCYQFNTDTRVTWMDAAAECAKTGSHLVYIDSSDEDRFVVNNLKHLIDESNGRDYLTSVWTGGADDQVEGSWVCYGNDQPILEYTNWYPGQADSGSGDHDEDCICLVGNHGYLWQDHKCTEKMYWVCEMMDSATGVVG